MDLGMGVTAGRKPHTPGESERESRPEGVVAITLYTRIKTLWFIAGGVADDINVIKSEHLELILDPAEAQDENASILRGHCG